MDPLGLDVRKKIYDCIAGSPGIHFREIQRQTGVAIGSLDYHLHFLHKHGLIRTEQDAKKRYYPLTQNWSEEEKRVLALLRQRTIRHILVFLLRANKAPPSDMARSLDMSASTLSWYLKNLTEQNVVAYTKTGRFRTYRIVDPKTIVKYLIVHRASFFDELVDNFIDTWSGK